MDDYSELMKPEVQAFIREHEHTDKHTISLTYKNEFRIPAKVIAEQIAGRQKAKLKLPAYYATAKIIYPPSVHLEQSSSEATAKFKATLVQSKGARRVADLTTGFGIDAFYMQTVVDKLYAVEKNESLLAIAKHNHRQLGATRIEYYAMNAQTFVEDHSNEFDFAYIDPSRRTHDNRKVFLMMETEPDITTLQHTIFERASHLLVKTSPLYEIQQGIKELRHVEQVYVLAVDNECKELLFLCSKNSNKRPTIFSINLGKQHQSFAFDIDQEKTATVMYSDPLLYLYEPNAAIMKAGAFKTIAQQFGLYKVHEHTHYYTSDTLIDYFPGRVFKIIAYIKPDKTEVAHYFPNGKANVTTRNYPLTPEQLKKKTGLKDGGDQFLIGFSGRTKKFTVVADAITNKSL